MKHIFLNLLWFTSNVNPSIRLSAHRNRWHSSWPSSGQQPCSSPAPWRWSFPCRQPEMENQMSSLIFSVAVNSVGKRTCSYRKFQKKLHSITFITKYDIIFQAAVSYGWRQTLTANKFADAALSSTPHISMKTPACQNVFCLFSPRLSTWRCVVDAEQRDHRELFKCKHRETK